MTAVKEEAENDLQKYEPADEVERNRHQERLKIAVKPF